MIKDSLENKVWEQRLGGCRWARGTAEEVGRRIYLASDDSYMTGTSWSSRRQTAE